ncbi:TIR domain-containing protein [Salinibacter sp.]|uniref:TIR domain-containing protein n=1 Tax=Salinibacter sp. TaxID=2065818 RepID=UPI0021E76486|nr:TIR domain-containing protein [Salinibacter sp.]
MRIFLSWSGKRSQYVAEQFDEWLPIVIQGVDTFMSERGIEAGNRWLKKIDAELETTNFGILFVTPENQNEPWLVHEAGALAKSIEESRVAPVTIDMAPSDIDWPLARFQASNLDQSGVSDLLTSINEAFGEDQLESSVLESSFEAQWPNLKKELDDLPSPQQENATPESSPEEAQQRRDEKLDEVLELVRGMSRTDGVEDLRERLVELKERNEFLVDELETKDERLRELQSRLSHFEEERRREREAEDQL